MIEVFTVILKDSLTGQKAVKHGGHDVLAVKAGLVEVVIGPHGTHVGILVKCLPWGSINTANAAAKMHRVIPKLDFHEPSERLKLCDPELLHVDIFVNI
jgi:hypothetical protein